MTFRWFKSFNVSLASERKQRSLANEIVGENLRSERAPFSCDKKDEFQEVPFVYRPNLIAAIADTVDQHERYMVNDVPIKLRLNLP